MNIIKDAVVIPKEYHLFKPLHFVCAAVSKDEQRFVFQHVLAEKVGGVWYYVALDGRRMHVHEMDPGMFDTDMDLLDAGLYTVVHKSTKVLVLQRGEILAEKFPDWRRIMPDAEPDEVLECAGSDMLGKLFLRTGRVFSYAFLSSALGYGSAVKPDELVSLEFWQEGGDGPLLIQHEHGRALVMPIRAEDTEEEPSFADEEEDEEEGGES